MQYRLYGDMYLPIHDHSSDVQGGNALNVLTLNDSGSPAVLHGSIDLLTLKSLGLTSYLNPTISGTVNDWAPTGWPNTIGISAVLTANRIITGFDASVLVSAQAISLFFLIHDGTAGKTLTLKHADTGSSSGNRIYCPNATDYVLNKGEGVWILYEGLTAGANAFRLIAPATPASSARTVIRETASGTINNWNPGLADNALVFWDNGGVATTLNGIAALSGDGLFYLQNSIATAITITHLSGAATGKQITCPGGVNYSLTNKAGIIMVYDATATVYRILDK